MKKYAALLVLSLLSSPAWACSSFEDCMATGFSDGREHCLEGIGKKGTKEFKYKEIPCDWRVRLAIAFKLADIDKKLE